MADDAGGLEGALAMFFGNEQIGQVAADRLLGRVPEHTFPSEVHRRDGAGCIHRHDGVERTIQHRIPLHPGILPPPGHVNGA